MDEASLEATIVAYKQQLQQIETVLQSSGPEGLADLLQLQKDLKDVIELTQDSLLSLRKSNLLEYVEDLTSAPNHQCIKDSKRTIDNSESAPNFDEEFAAFQAAIAEEDETCSSVAGTSTTLKGQQISPQPDENDVKNDDDDDDDDDDGNYAQDLEDISGTKCSFVYKHEWGPQQRQNAVVYSVEADPQDNDEVRVRILFCNPTTASMKPCPYYFKGECKFDDDECRFSHGHVVKISELVPFQEVDLSQVKIEGKCLAKFEDDIWYPAMVTDIDVDTRQVTVCFESYGNSSTLDIQHILPSGTLEDDDDVDKDDDDSSSELSDHDMPSTSRSVSSRLQNEEEDEEEMVDVVWTPSGPSCRLGEWEAHTRGIGSKLMAMMGYEVGKGLGKHGEGRTEPVEAVIVPAGKSLDTCMKLKEMKKLGIVGRKKKRRGKGRKKKKKQGSVGGLAKNKLRKAKDVFEFINTHLGAKKVKVNELLTDNIELVKSHRVHRESNKEERAANARQLNVQILKTQEEIRSSEKRITHLKQSLARNQRDKAMSAQIQAKITKTEDYLQTLKSSQRKLERQKTTRDEHKKLTIF